MSLLTALAERRREIAAEKQRELAHLEDEIRRQRRADLAAAEEQLRSACVEREQLKDALERDDQAKHVEQLRRRFCDLVQAFNDREPFRPGLAPNLPRPAGVPIEVPAVIPADWLKRTSAARDAFYTQEQQQLAEIRAAEGEYRAAAMDQAARVNAFDAHPIHARILELRQLRDAAFAALDEPI